VRLCHLLWLSTVPPIGIDQSREIRELFLAQSVTLLDFGLPRPYVVKMSGIHSTVAAASLPFPSKVLSW
jgi:hypothetical protein